MGPTWVSPELLTENQIDHVCMGKKCRRSLQDVCVKLGADVAWDHHLLIAKLKLKLKRAGQLPCPRYDSTVLLKDTTTQQGFEIVLLNKFQALDKLLVDGTINEKWQAIKEPFTSTCKEVLSKKNTTKKNGSQLRPSWRSRKEKEKNICKSQQQ